MAAWNRETKEIEISDGLLTDVDSFTKYLQLDEASFVDVKDLIFKNIRKHPGTYYKLEQNASIVLNSHFEFAITKNQNENEDDLIPAKLKFDGSLKMQTTQCSVYS